MWVIRWELKKKIFPAEFLHFKAFFHVLFYLLGLSEKHKELFSNLPFITLKIVFCPFKMSIFFIRWSFLFLEILLWTFLGRRVKFSSCWIFLILICIQNFSNHHWNYCKWFSGKSESKKIWSFQHFKSNSHVILMDFFQRVTNRYKIIEILKSNFRKKILHFTWLLRGHSCITFIWNYYNCRQQRWSGTSCKYTCSSQIFAA